DERLQPEPDFLVEGSDPESADGTELQVENDEDPPRHRRRRGKRKQPRAQTAPDIRTARQKSLRRFEPSHIEPPDPRLAGFCKHAFSYGGDGRGWPSAFRQWASGKYRIHHNEQVTRDIMTEWREYEVAQILANQEKAEFDYDELDNAEYWAGVEQWE